MGTPALSARVLSGIAAHHNVVGVFTRPDAVRGRGKKLVASPVKQTAEQLGLPVRCASTLRCAEEREALESMHPDVICVAACGMLLPEDILRIPRLGCLNVHTSLLPRWRGAAPMQRAILACDEYSGVSIMKMEEALDTGDYCKQERVALDGVYYEELQVLLAQTGTKLLLEALEELEAGTLAWTKQPQEGITYADKIARKELDLSPADLSVEACAKVRASDDAHPAHVILAGRNAIIEKAWPATDDRARAIAASLLAGQAVFREKRLILMANDAPFEVGELKPEGKKSMDARAFAAGIQGVKKETLTWGRP